jgi:nucleotide-binding universal stress UspA family protein
MAVYDAVLLPTDGSPSSDAAADHVADLALDQGATVHVLSVADTRNRFESPSSGIAPDVWDDAEEERAGEAARAAVDRLPDSVDTEIHVESGVPRTAILEAVEDLPVDLVVMGTHGRTGLDHYLIGSVAERVVRTSPVPVLTLRANDD